MENDIQKVNNDRGYKFLNIGLILLFAIYAVIRIYVAVSHVNISSQAINIGNFISATIWIFVVVSLIKSKNKKPNISDEQRFYLGQIYFLLFGLLLILFSAQNVMTMYVFINFILGTLSLLLAWKLKKIITHKLAIYIFLFVLFVDGFVYTATSYFTALGILDQTKWFLVLVGGIIGGAMTIVQIDVIPTEPASKKVPTKSLVPFFLITLAVAVIIISFLMYQDWSK